MTSRPSSDALTQSQDQFIAVWGQMGSAWGISRTMAEVHALLYITGEPMCTDDIMDRLEISRGNASMSLRALLEWGIVARTHKRGDRKEYFVAEQDVWAMFRAIVRERIKREVDPLMASLYEIRDITQPHARADAKPVHATPAAVGAHNARLDELIEFFQTLEKLSQRFVSPAGRGLQIAASVLSGSVFGGTSRDAGREPRRRPGHDDLADLTELPERGDPAGPGEPRGPDDAGGGREPGRGDYP